MAESGSNGLEMPTDDCNTMILIINGLSFSGPCLLAVCSLLVVGHFTVVMLLNLQNRLFIWGL